MSHDRAAKAQKDGLFDDEIVKVEIPQRKGDPILVQRGRGRPRRHHRSSRSPPCARPSTRPATSPPATPRRSPTAARPSSCAPRPRPSSSASIRSAAIVGYGQVAGPDPSLLHQPADAIQQALERAGKLSVGDLDLFELNEAFAAVGVASMDRPRHHRRHHQRQRWRHRPRSPASACRATAWRCTCSTS